MTWHIPSDMLADYQDGRLDSVRTMSVEAHVSRCEPCRSAFAPDEQWLVGSWDGVLDVIDQPRRGMLERFLCQLGIPEDRVRLLVATPALRRSWLLAMGAVLLFAVLSARLGEGDSPRRFLLFLAIAPVLPVLAVAAAYGPHVDPVHEIQVTTPMAGPTLLALRSTAVLVTSLLMGVVAAAFLPAPGWLAVAWLLPALALCLASLALSTAMAPQVAAPLLGGCWVAALVVAVGLSDNEFVVFGPAAQAGYVLAGSLASTILIWRHRRLDPGERR